MHIKDDDVEQSVRSDSIAVRTSSQIAAAIPFLVGFHPDESLVALWMRNGVLIVAQRADLPDHDSIEGFVDAYLLSAAGIAADEVLFACFTRQRERGQAIVEQAHACAPVLSRGGVLIDGSRVREVSKDGQWKWISTLDRQWARENFAAGQREAPRADRDSVVMDAAFDEELFVRVGPIQDAKPDIDALAAVITSADMSDPGIRTLRDCCRTVQGRDIVMWWAARAAMPARSVLLEQLLASLRASPSGAHVACAAAVVAWLCGDGVRANACIDRCLFEDPQHLMGLMLEGAMGAAVPPSTFAHMLAEVEPTSLGLEESWVDEHLRPRYSPV